MSATSADIQRWLATATTKGSRYLVVGLDRFAHENYPIYVAPDEDVWYIIDHLGDNGTGGMGDSYDEVYDLQLDIPTQFAEFRALHLPPRPTKT